MDGDLSRSCEAPPLDAAETRKEWERRIRASKEADFDLEHQSQKHLRSCLQGLRKRSGDRDTSEPVQKVNLPISPSVLSIHSSIPNEFIETLRLIEIHSYATSIATLGRVERDAAFDSGCLLDEKLADNKLADDLPLRVKVAEPAACGMRSP